VTRMEAFEPGPDTETDFRRALGRFATGVTIVTCDSELGPLGITANSFASVSLDPPLVLWSPARASARFEAFASAEHYAIHVMAEDQAGTCLRFTRTGDDWSGLEWQLGPDGVPLLVDCLARFDCIRHAVHEGGDHAIVVGRVVSVRRGRGGRPLLFADGTYGRFLPDI
jgi:flavin reductase (DIM6/NTAB) family NADH-FMN oxidoreductase RutF